MVQLTTKDTPFPKPEKGNRYGLIAVGGDLSPERLIMAYENGVFPWSDYRDAMLRWYCPYTRFVIFPSEIHVSHSTRNLFNKGIYQITFNKDFENVIRNCSELRIHMLGAWLGPAIVDAYTELHRLGKADSVEVWRDGKLVGGLYGVHQHGVFSGESMFSLDPGASKLALVSLARKMEAEGEKMIDCQYHTRHLASMGGRHVEYDEYMRIMKE